MITTEGIESTEEDFSTNSFMLLSVLSGRIERCALCGFYIYNFLLLDRQITPDPVPL